MTRRSQSSPRLNFAWLAGLILPLTFASGVFAQTPEIRVELAGQRVVIAEGKESLVPADKAGPGDVIQYAAVYRNAGQSVAKNVTATVPIPKGMALVAESAKPAAEQASLNGKDFSPVPLLREVKNDAGILEKRPVPVAEYRALRWTLPELAPEKTATFVLRAQLLTNSPAK